MKKFANKKIATLLATLSVFTPKTQAMNIQKKVNNYQILDNNFSSSEFLDQHKELLLLSGGLGILSLGTLSYLLLKNNSKDNKLEAERKLKDKIRMFLYNLPKSSDVLAKYAKYFKSTEPEDTPTVSFMQSEYVFKKHLNCEENIKCVSTQEDIQNNKLILSHNIFDANAKDIFIYNGSLIIIQ